MADRGPFPYAELMVAQALCDLVDSCADVTAADSSIGTNTPSDLLSALPFIRVQRIGGEDDGYLDAALVAIDVFELTVSGAYTLAEQVRQRLISGPNTVAAGTIDKATTATAPNEVPWSDSQELHRFAAVYRVTARR